VIPTELWSSSVSLDILDKLAGCLAPLIVGGHSSASSQIGS
jgi:hypothetical protein